jgi:flagellar motor switch protein FliN
MAQPFDKSLPADRTSETRIRHVSAGEAGGDRRAHGRRDGEVRQRRGDPAHSRTMQVVLGSATIPVANLMKLGRGAVVPLDHRVGEPVDVVVNGRIVARGEVVVVEEDNSRFGVSLTEIVGPLGGNGEV